jgi:chromosome segregation ATPase
MKDNVQKKLRSIEDQKITIESEKELLRNQTINLEREIENAKKEQEKDRKEIEDLTRERDLLNKNLQKAAGAISVVKIPEPDGEFTLRVEFPAIERFGSLMSRL